MNKIVSFYFLFFFLILGFSSGLYSQESRPAAISAPLDHSIFSGLLKRFVNKYGLVDYAAFKKDKDAVALLNSYLDDLMKIDGLALEPVEERKAYWLNLYNGLVLREILKHYPIQTVTQVQHFFDEQRYELAAFKGEKLSLIDLEQRVFVERFNDPRLHLIRVNGAMSAPPLLQEAFQSRDLDKKLEELTLAFLLDPVRNFYDQRTNTLFASPLFLWFDKHFMIWNVSPRVFIHQRLRGLPLSFKLAFMGYDWKLNDAKNR